MSIKTRLSPEEQLRIFTESLKDGVDNKAYQSQSKSSKSSNSGLFQTFSFKAS